MVSEKSGIGIDQDLPWGSIESSSQSVQSVPHAHELPTLAAPPSWQRPLPDQLHVLLHSAAELVAFARTSARTEILDSGCAREVSLPHFRFGLAMVVAAPSCVAHGCIRGANTEFALS